MYKSYACIKEKEIDDIEKNVIELKTNYVNFKKDINEVKENQRFIIKLLISGLITLGVEIIGLLIGFIFKFVG